MTCDQAIELLPWYLNGTLHPGERAEIQKHLQDCEPCRKALTETRETWGLFTQHLPAGDLVALAYGEEPSVGREIAEQHLAWCPECAAELELARMSCRLEEEDEGKVVLFPGATRPRTNQTYRGWRAAAVAASLSAVVAGAGWLHSARQGERMAALTPTGRPHVTAESQAPAESNQAEAELAQARGEIVRLRDKGAELERRVKQNPGEPPPQMAQKTEASSFSLTKEPWISDVLHSREFVRDRGDSGEAAVQVIPANVSLAVVPLQTLRAETGAHKDHEAVILSENGEKAATRHLGKNDNGWYLLALAKGELKPGTYTVQVYGTAGGRRDPEPDGIYSIQVK
jgi:hypothetical protein